MFYIKDKMNYVNTDAGFLTASEFNSVKNELANVVKYRNVLVDNDDTQLLKAIITESKVLFYKDQGTKNHIVLNRLNENSIKLVDAQTFIFRPSFTNDDVTYIKVGDNTEIILKLGGTDLPVNFLDPTVTYIAVYDSVNICFDLMDLTIGARSNFVFSSMHNEANFTEVTDLELGTDISNNKLVYIDQISGKFELSKVENPKTQKQNAIGIFKIIAGKKYVFYSGIVPDFYNNLVSGFKYYLSRTSLGDVSTVVNGVLIGRYLKDGKFLLDINGDVSIPYDYVGIKEFMNNLNDGDNSNGVIFTDNSKLFTLMFDTTTFNPNASKKVMYLIAGGYNFRIDFATEYTNNEFNIEINGDRYVGVFKEATNINNPIEIYLFGQTVYDSTKPVLSSTNKTFTTTLNIPLTLEAVTASDNADGTLNVVKVGTPNFAVAGTYPVTYTATDSTGNISTITHTYVVSAIIIYNNNLVNPQNGNGVTLTDPSTNMIFMFDTKTFDPTTPAVVMFFKVNNLVAKIDYATEYAGKTFEVEIATVRYIGTFTENENYANPIVINVK